MQGEQLTGPCSGRGAAGKWRDAATDEHGDLIDLIRLNLGLGTLGEALDEARSFLSLPSHRTEARRHANPHRGSKARTSSEIARAHQRVADARSAWDRAGKDLQSARSDYDTAIWNGIPAAQIDVRLNDLSRFMAALARDRVKTWGVDL